MSQGITGVPGLYYHGDSKQILQTGDGSGGDIQGQTLSLDSKIKLADKSKVTLQDVNIVLGLGNLFQNNTFTFNGDASTPGLNNHIFLDPEANNNIINLQNDADTALTNNGYENTIFDNTSQGELDDSGTQGNITYATNSGTLDEAGLNNIVNFDASSQTQTGQAAKFNLSGQGDTVNINLGSTDDIDLTKGLNNTVSISQSNSSTNSMNNIAFNLGTTFTVSNGELVAFDPTTKTTTTINANVQANLTSGTNNDGSVQSIIASLQPTQPPAAPPTQPPAAPAPESYLANINYTPGANGSAGSLDQAGDIDRNSYVMTRSNYADASLNTNLGTTYGFTNTGFEYDGSGTTVGSAATNFNLGSNFSSNQFLVKNDFNSIINNAGNNNHFNVTTTQGDMDNYGTGNTIAYTTQNGGLGDDGIDNTINFDSSTQTTASPAYFTFYNGAKDDTANLNLGNSTSVIDLTQLNTALPSVSSAGNQADNNITVDSGSTNSTIDLNSNYTSTLLSDGDLQLKDAATGNTTIIKAGVNVTVNAVNPGGSYTTTTAADIIKSLNTPTPTPTPTQPPAPPKPTTQTPTVLTGGIYDSNGNTGFVSRIATNGTNVNDEKKDHLSGVIDLKTLTDTAFTSSADNPFSASGLAYLATFATDVKSSNSSSASTKAITGADFVKFKQAIVNQYLKDEATGNTTDEQTLKKYFKSGYDISGNASDGSVYTINGDG